MVIRLLWTTLIVLFSTSVFAEQYTWDFRNGHFDNLSLVPLGPGAVNLLKPTPEGLRIVVPAGQEVKSVGFSPRFRIRGDFVITIDFTILKRTQPERGFGTGPSIYVSMGTPQDPAASLGRMLRPDGKDRYGVFAARVEDGKRVPTARLFDVPPLGASQAGQLQLKRVKDEITYSVAENPDSEPRRLAALPVSDSDVTLLRIGLMQSDPQSAGEILLHNINIEAAGLPQLPSEQSRTDQLYRPSYQPPAAPKSYVWLWQPVAALLLFAAFSIWLWRRYRAN